MNPLPGILLLLPVFVSGATLGATPPEQIARAEAQLASGLASRDVKLLDPLVGEPFTWVHSSDGRVDDRETWLAGAARGMALSGQRLQRTEHGATLQLHGDPAHTAVRIARVRLVDGPRGRESWLRQTHTWVLAPSGLWRLVMGQGVTMYDGPLLDPALHARYAGIYGLEDGRRLVLEWKDEALLATFPNGAQTQIFLSSPTEEVVRNASAGALRFTLDERGVPRTAALVRAGQEMWRATKR